MLWGDLKPIWKYVVIDTVLITLTIYAISIFEISNRDAESCANIWSLHEILSHYGDEIFMMVIALCTLGVYGTTHRWPLTLVLHLPVTGLMIISNLLHAYAFRKERPRIIQIISFILTAFSTLLLILFPTVRLAEVKGKYWKNDDKEGDIGVVDIFLPVSLVTEEEEEILRPKYPDNGENTTSMTVRLFYPSEYSRHKTGISYISKNLCDIFIQITNPKPLSSFGMLIHAWCLTKLPAVRNAKPRDCRQGGKGMNLAFYSHGLYGNSTLYSYQAMSLAAEGYIVMMLDHRDGSQVSTKTQSGEMLLHNFYPSKLLREGKHIDELKFRRKQTEFRSIEIIVALRSLIQLNERNPDILEKIGVSFVGKINIVRGVLACGHSFGGATALSVAARASNLCSAVIAHEPATNWMCDFGRHALFKHDRTYTGGKVYGYDTNFEFNRNQNDAELHNLEMLFLFSNEWKDKDWGECERLLKMNKDGLIGSKLGISKVDFIRNANHSAFSDCCMLIPLWIARPMQLTGSECPHKSAHDIRNTTLSFLELIEDCPTKICG